MGDLWFRDFSQIRFINDSGPVLPRRQSLRIRGMSGVDTGSEIVLDNRQIAPLLDSLEDGSETGQLVTVRGRVRVGDAGANLSYRWVASADEASATVPDGVLVIEGASGTWHLLWDGERLVAGAAGAQGDVKRITDGVRVAGAYTLQSPSGAFVDAQPGMRVLITEPSDPCTGTVTLIAGTHDVVGAGTNFLSIPREPYDASIPSTGGCVFVGTDLYVIRAITSDTAAIAQETLPGGAGLTLYKEVQTEATILSVDSPTQVTLDAVALVSRTGLSVSFGTDDEDAINALFAVARTLWNADPRRLLRLVFSGVYGVYNNIVLGAEGTDPEWESKRPRNLRIVGMKCNRLRKCSWQQMAGAPDFSPGGVTAILPINVRFEDFGYNDNVPKLGVLHSTGGVSNGSGGRVGICMRHPTQCGYYDCTQTIANEGYGARDEYLYADSSYEVYDFVWSNCNLEMCNGNAINPNSGHMRRVGVYDCVAGSFFSPIQMTVYDGIVSNFRGFGQKTIKNGNGLIVLEASARLIVNGLVAESAVTDETSVSTVQIYGFDNPDAELILSGVRVRNVDGGFQSAGAGAPITFSEFGGHAAISDVIIGECTAVSAGGRHILFTAQFTGSVEIGRGVFLNSGMNMDRGVEIDAAATGFVSGLDNIICAPSVTSPVVGAFDQYLTTQTISTNGTNPVDTVVKQVNVTHNGATTAQLPGPSTMPKGWTVVVSNDSTQLGTTTVGTASGSIVGTTTLVGAGATGTFMAFASTWRRIA
jgi:hypothetical protein